MVARWLAVARVARWLAVVARWFAGARWLTIVGVCGGWVARKAWWVAAAGTGFSRWLTDARVGSRWLAVARGGLRWLAVVARRGWVAYYSGGSMARGGSL